MSRQSENEAAALYESILRKPAYGDIGGALESITNDEIDSLREDLASGPTRDQAHAGSILVDALERFARKCADRYQEDLERDEREIAAREHKLNRIL